MKTLNKQFEYNGRTFNVKVVLNYAQERSLDGKTWHEVTVNDLELSAAIKNQAPEFKVVSTYTQRKEVLKQDLEKEINAMIN